MHHPMHVGLLDAPVQAGASIPPETMMHFPPLFQISPLFSKIFKILWEISKILPFPEKISDFHPPKFLMTFFLVIDHICPSDWRKLLFPPYFHKFPPPVFRKIHQVLEKIWYIFNHVQKIQNLGYWFFKSCPICNHVQKMSKNVQNFS